MKTAYTDIYRIKSIGEGAIKDVDTLKGVVTGYFSSFGSTDSDGDIIQPGAFKKTIAENGPTSKSDRIQYLFNHDPNKLIGKIYTLQEDSFGLYFESKMAANTHGKDALILYNEKILREHSIGFQTVKGEPNMDSNGYLIQEVKLWEGSAVTWGANQNTPVTSVKSLFHKGETPLEAIEKVSNILRKGNLSDEMCIQLELQLKQILNYLALEEAERAVKKDTQEVKEPQIDLVGMYKSFSGFNN